MYNHRFLHPPLTDPASSVKPADHNSTGKEENHCRLIRKSSSAWMIVGMFVPQLLWATKAAGLLSAAHFWCVGPAHACACCVLAHLRSLRSSDRYSTEVTLNRKRHLSRAEGGSDIQLKPASSRMPPNERLGRGTPRQHRC